MARTRAQDYGDKREAILRASARAFSTGGVDRTSMGQIAAACGVSKALLYHYYESKDALIFDIIRDHLEELLAAVEAADREDAAPEERLRLLVHATLEKYADRDDQHKIQIEALSNLPEDRAEHLRGVERAIVRKFAGVIAELNPRLASGDARLTPATMSLFGILNWVYMWFRPGGRISRAEYADMAARLFVGGVRSL